MHIDYEALNSHLAQYNELSNKQHHTKADERRMAYLQTAISALKAGASVEEVLDSARRADAKQYGITLDKNPDAKTIEARGWQSFVEKRDMVEGNSVSRIGTYSGLGYFSPTEFFPTVFLAMAAHDALFDEDSCTVIKTKNGRVTTVPLIGDIENVATVVGESGTQTSTDISSTGQAVLGAYSYKTPRFVASIESFQDVDEALSVVNLFKNFTADRLARGIAKDLVTGNGSSKPEGLIPSLTALGVLFVTASGSAANTGGAETGASSLGSADFAAALAEIDDAYIQSPKCAWLMTRKTLVTVSSIINKFGNQLNLVQWVDGERNATEPIFCCAEFQQHQQQSRLAFRPTVCNRWRSFAPSNWEMQQLTSQRLWQQVVGDFSDHFRNEFGQLYVVPVVYFKPILQGQRNVVRQHVFTGHVELSMREA